MSTQEPAGKPGGRTEIVLRGVLALLGLVTLGWGAVLAWPLVKGLSPTSVSLLAWFVGGPVLHDVLLAPALTLGALVLARWLPPSWRVPVIVGAVLTGVLTLLAVPLLWREYGGALLPGLHDRNYVAGLLIWLAVLWAGVLAVGLLRHRSARGSHTNSNTSAE